MKTPFDRVVAQHSTMVHRICRSVAGATDADDAWSETFLAAMRAWPTLAEDANVRAWLATIARNASIDQRRARLRAQPTDPADLERRLDGRLTNDRITDDRITNGRLTDGFGPFAHSGGRQRDDELASALAQLTPRQRDAVLYHHVAGFPHAETAALIGGNAASVRRAAADGIAALRRLLATAPEDR